MCGVVACSDVRRVHVLENVSHIGVRYIARWCNYCECRLGVGAKVSAENNLCYI